MGSEVLSLDDFSISRENELIKELAQDLYQQCKDHANSRHLELYYVIEKTVKELNKLIYNDALLNN